MKEIINGFIIVIYLKKPVTFIKTLNKSSKIDQLSDNSRKMNSYKISTNDITKQVREKPIQLYTLYLEKIRVLKHQVDSLLNLAVRNHPIIWNVPSYIMTLIVSICIYKWWKKNFQLIWNQYSTTGQENHPLSVFFSPKQGDMNFARYRTYFT